MKPCDMIITIRSDEDEGSKLEETDETDKQTDLGEEIVPHDVVQVRAVHGVLREHAGDDLLGGEREAGGNGVTCLSDTSVRLLQVSGLERRFTGEHGVPGEEALSNWGHALRITLMIPYAAIKN